MSDITLSAAVRSNLLSLQNTAELMDRTQTRLATGNKVNSALDNPSSFFTAQGLNNRAGDFSNLLDSMSNGIQVLDAADNGLKSITTTLQSMQSTLQQARSDSSFQASNYTLDSSLTSGSLTLSGGALASAVKVDLTDATSTVAAKNAIATATGTIDATTTAAANAKVTSTVDLTAGLADPGTDITFTINSKTVTLSTGSGTGAGTPKAFTLNDIETAINGVAGIGVTASDDGSGHLVLTSSGTAGSTDSIVTSGLSTAGLGIADGTVNGTDASGGIDASGGDITFKVNNTTVTLSATGGTNSDGHYSLNDVKGAINSASAGVTASDDGSGHLILTSSGTAGASDKVTVDGFSTGSDATLLGFGSATVTANGSDATTGGTALTVDQLVSSINNNTNLQGKVSASNDSGHLRLTNLSSTALTVDGASSTGTIDGSSTGANTIAGNSVRSGLVDQFNTLRDQLDKTAGDASYNGINILNGDDLKITFNPDGTSTIDIQSDLNGTKGTALNSKNLGVDALTDNSLDANSGIDALLNKVSAALNSVRSQSSKFGSNLSVVQNRQDFTKAMINTLQTGAANLTLADSNEEAANMVALQTRQQLSIRALSLAGQSDQSILQLLR